ncbi:MAG: endonuclease/exonuclease/phosphatase family protein [Phycisphaerales bacterium]|nr:endonuclease/exonuclease/phosphatase family protein [Planctomycetota bacterium]
MKLLHWNILHGGGARRMPEIGLALVELQPDFILLSEYRTSIGGQLRGILADHGLVHQASTNPPKGKNGLLAACRSPFKVVSTPPRHDSPTRWLDMHLPEEDLFLTGVHIPDDSKPTARASFWLAMVELARVRAQGNHVFFGDFNTGRHYEDEPGATFTCTRHLGTVCTLGYGDAFRALHPKAREWTWLPPPGWNISPAKTGVSSGFRIDSALVSGALLPRLREARYEHFLREAGVSDHSAMIVCLDLETARTEKSQDFVQKTAIF